MDVTLPNGTVVNNVPDNISKADLVAKLSANGMDTSWYKPEETSPLTGSAKASIESMKADAYAIAGRTGLMDINEAERQAKEHAAKAEQVYKPTEQGWTEAPLTKVKELFGGSIPYMALPLAAGAAATLAPEAAIAGGLILSLIHI